MRRCCSSPSHLKLQYSFNMLPSQILTGLLSLLPFTSALPTALQRRTAADAPRLVNYVQTFHDVNNNPLSLLPLLNENTGITHINLASIHINTDPSGITLNDINPNSSYWDSVWSDVKQLQNGGIKALFMIGGAAAGSYPRLCGTKVPAVIVSCHEISLLTPDYGRSANSCIRTKHTTVLSATPSATTTSTASTSTSKNPST